MEFRMHKYIIAALLAGTAGATPALAQEGAPFTGPRVEAIVGYDHVDISGVRNPDGVLYGVGVGYDFQAGSALVGVEGEASDSTAKTCENSSIVTGDRLCLKTGRDLYVGGRIGAVMGRALVYAKAGYTNARLKAEYDDGGTGALDDSDSTNLDGVRVGAGAEMAMGTNSFIKAEYRYSNYENGVERHQALAGFGFRF
jgi:outer membrane immunogenic protein